MSGHNKWSTIKNKKAKTDAAKGKIFTKIGREIVIAVKTGGSADPALNSKLKDVIAKAKAANMPNDNIQRSIKKAAGEGESTNYKEVTYEGYAPCGVAVIVEIVTDNLNRTASEMRHIFDKCGGSLGATGCVSWKFERKGVIVVDNSKGMDEDELMDIYEYFEEADSDDLDDALAEPSPKLLIPKDMPMEAAGEHVVSYSDLDLIGHTNNARYVVWAMDCLPLEEAERPVKDLYVNFNKETTAGECVELYRLHTGNAWYVEGKVDGKSCFVVKMEY